MLERWAVSTDVNGYRRLHNQGLVYQSTRRHIPEDLSVRHHIRAKLKSRYTAVVI